MFIFRYKKNQFLAKLHFNSFRVFCHLEDDKAAAASIGTPLQIKFVFLHILLYHDGPALGHFSGICGDLVNEDALGVDVLGPRLAVEGHLLLRKKFGERGFADC